MGKLFALGAYFYQAGLAFGILILVARVLPAAEYAGYSIFMAATMFVAVCFFEWIRFACSRFYPGRDAQTEADQRAVLLAEMAGAAIACSASGLVALLFGVPPVIAVLGALTAIFQGGSDIHLTMLRFRRQFSDFSWLQGLRATVLAGGSIAGALAFHSLAGTASGLVLGYLLFAAVAVAVELRTVHPRGVLRGQIVREHLSYGSVTAGASVIGLLAPLGLRVILSSTLGAQASAGALLAVDLLQKPFVLIVSALQAIQYPDVVSAFDAPERKGLASHLGQYYALLVTLSLVTGAGILAVLLPVAEIAVAQPLRAAFLETAPLLTFVFMLRSLTQNMSTTPAHLEKDLAQMIVLALIDCLGLDLLAFVAALVPGASALLIIGAAAIGTLAAGAYGLRILLRLPFEVYAAPMLFGLAGLCVPAYLLLVPAASIWIASGVALLAAGISSLGGLYGLSRIMGLGQPKAPA